MRLDESYIALEAKANRMDRELMEFRELRNCDIQEMPAAPHTGIPVEYPFDYHNSRLSLSPVPSPKRFWSDDSDIHYEYVRRDVVLT